MARLLDWRNHAQRRTAARGIRTQLRCSFLNHSSNPFACAFGTTATLFVIVLESGPRDVLSFLDSENKCR
jgi:hypothetical protein